MFLLLQVLELIYGQIYHNVYALHPNKNKARKYGQLYVLDDEKATAQRKNHKSNSDIKAEYIFREKYFFSRKQMKIIT